MCIRDSLYAVCGAISVKALIADRVFFMVFCSKNDPSWNKNVTIADSLNSPIRHAPMAAMDTKSSMLTVLNRSACMARKRIGRPDRTNAIKKSTFASISKLSICEKTIARRFKMPAAHKNCKRWRFSHKFNLFKMSPRFLFAV